MDSNHSKWFSMLCMLFVSHVVRFTIVDRMSSCCDGTTDNLSIYSYLAELDFNGNALTKLPDAVGEMEHLTSIDLANNNFSTFPLILTEIATLERINLEGNCITGNNIFSKVEIKGSIFSVDSVIYIFLHRDSNGEAVRHASTEVAQREVKSFDCRHSISCAVPPQIWHFVENRGLTQGLTFSQLKTACCVPFTLSVGHFLVADNP